MTSLAIDQALPRAELVSPAEELVATFAQSLGTAGSRETVRTYTGACERFGAWLVEREGPSVGPEALTLANVAAYEEALAGVGLSLATIRKDRSAINRMLGFLADHELMDPTQARLARSRSLPAAHHGERECPKALTDVAYRRLLTEAEATVASDPLLGWRDVAIVRLLGDAGLRIEELLALDRADFVPKRKGARLRAIRVRHGKGNRQRIVELTPTATTAVRRWG
jgi:integrase/recombinase XerC